MWRRSVLQLASGLALGLGLGHPAAWASSEIAPWPPSRSAPELRLADLDGQAWNLKDLRGRVVLLNFWATWCEPCRAEMPSLASLAERHGSARLQVLGVNYQETPSRIRRFLQTTPVGFPMLVDKDGAVTKSWTRGIFPTTVIIDARGIPRGTVTGEFDWASADAAALLEPYLKAVAR